MFNPQMKQTVPTASVVGKAETVPITLWVLSFSADLFHKHRQNMSRAPGTILGTGYISNKPNRQITGLTELPFVFLCVCVLGVQRAKTDKTQNK